MATAVKFYNQTSEDITVGAFGNSGDETFRQYLAVGQNYVASLYSGSRAFVAWDQFLDEILALDKSVLADGQRLKARVTANGWAFALVPPNQGGWGD